MTTQNTSQQQNSIWADEDMANFLRLRIKTFYNGDYFERIILPLMNIPQNGRVLDVGCGYGGLSLTLAGLRPDLHILGVDVEADALASAAAAATQSGWANVAFEQGDGHQLKYEDNQFDAVLCQTLLIHVRDAQAVVRDMTRVLKPGGVFFAAEFSFTGTDIGYDSSNDARLDRNWHSENHRIYHLYMDGKKALGLGDNRDGWRIPLLATNAGLDVFDVRLNDRTLHVIPPYSHQKQKDYLELLKVFYIPSNENDLKDLISKIQAGGGTEGDAQWWFRSVDKEAILKAIADNLLTMISADLLFLTFARKPIQ